MAKYKLISERLRNAVENVKESRYRISKETGITEGQLSRFVHGESGLTLDTIDILAEYLGLELVQRKRKR